MSTIRAVVAPGIAGAAVLAIGILIGATLAAAPPSAHSPPAASAASASVLTADDVRRVVRDDLADAAPGTGTHPVPGTAVQGEPRVPDPRHATRAKSRSTAPPGLTAADIREVVREELARMVAGESAEPPPPDPADPEFNADPEQRAAVRESVSLLRRSVVVHDLRYSMGPGQALQRPDEARLERLPDERVWLSRPLGWVEADPERYEVLRPDGAGFDPARESAAYVFTGPLDRAIATATSASLIFRRGVTESGVVTLQSSGTLLCQGDFAGKLFLEGYATVVIEGDVTGSIVSTSYATILVRGRLGGRYESRSYANLRVLGGFDGEMKLHDGTNVYFARFVQQSALERMTFDDRVTVTFESTDLAPGNYKGKSRAEIIVLEPR